MGRYVDFLIELIRFAGVVVAAAAVCVAVVRAGLASLAGERSQRMTSISLDLARTFLIGLDLLLVAAALDAAIYVDRADFVRLATVAGLRIALTLLVSFELAFRADTAPGTAAGALERRRRAAPPWETAIRRRFRSPSTRRADGHPSTSARPRHARPGARVVAADRAVDNVWVDRARLGRE
jgi:uncharacterized membrane protein